MFRKHVNIVVLVFMGVAGIANAKTSAIDAKYKAVGEATLGKPSGKEKASAGGGFLLAGWFTERGFADGFVFRIDRGRLGVRDAGDSHENEDNDIDVFPEHGFPPFFVVIASLPTEGRPERIWSG